MKTIKTIKTDLNVSDTAVLIDMLIEASKKTDSLVIAEWQLEIIDKLTTIHYQILTNEKG